MLYGDNLYMSILKKLQTSTEKKINTLKIKIEERKIKIGEMEILQTPKINLQRRYLEK
jgi:hypothetical protein